jgi:AraC-like DNA-binding protein
MDLEREANLVGFTVLDVHDPSELDERSQISGRLPGSHTTHTYMLRDKALRRSAPQTVLTRYAIRQVGDLLLSRVSDRFGTEICIGGDGVGAYCFGLLHTGRMALSVPDRNGVTELASGSGPVHRGPAGMRAWTSDGNVRTNIWIATRRFEAALQATLGDTTRRPLVFEPRIDWTVGAGASLWRMLVHITEEFARPDGLADNPLAAVAFVDLFVHTALRGLPHSYAERLAASRDGPVPAHLHRAEAYFHAHADQPVRLEEAAFDAGCSVRTLQRAFIQFRGTTAHAALLSIRLMRARADLGADGTGVAAVARRYGFTHPGRFSAAYARQFNGETPSDTIMRRKLGR